MINRFFLLLVILFSFSLQARGFVEAQIVYDKQVGSANHFVASWDLEAQQATIEMKVVLTNYEKSWHEGGFNLSNSKKRYINFPEPGPNCHVAEITGKIDPLQAKGSYIKIILKGSACGAELAYYQLMDVALTFYDVPSLDEKLITPVVRVLIIDAPRNDL
ncbi:MAG: hypothetical protein HOO06_05255 [Bdellovibrionaceae bacterium]|jgi:hypothetical protein|nr:hypothetical protein [Pseudobdellovibrionaceae bacterium]